MEKTYVFDTADRGSFDHSALIASLMQNKGVDPNLMAMLTNASKNTDAWGGGGMWWIWVIIMFWLWGGNGNGFGRGFNGIPNQLNNDFGRDILLQAINGNGTAISQLASTLNCDVNTLQTAIGQVQSSIQSVGNQVGMSGQQIINAIQAGNCQLGNQLAQCCCDLRTAITTQGYEGQLRTIQQTNDILQGATSNTNILAAKIDAQTQIINDKFCQLEMREMANTIQNLRDQVRGYELSASQQLQTANIVSQIRPCPTPAYVVPNPFGCSCNNYGYPCRDTYDRCGC